MKPINIFSILTTILVTVTASCKKEPDKALSPVNTPPVANAGKDTIIRLPANQVQLDGTGSNDPDNNIRSYRWTKNNGPASCVIAKPDSAITNVTNLVKGVYEFMLTVTDTRGATSQDICIVRVDSITQPSTPVNNIFWISMNPHDTVLNLPANAVTLTASTWSMTNQPIQPAIANIEWRKVAGPDNYTIQTPGALSTDINDLTDGLYAFQCKITDTSGRSAVSYGGVINVTDTTTAGQEILIPNLTWDGLGWCSGVILDLNLYVPDNRSIKKVFVKTDCDTVFNRAYCSGLQAPPGAIFWYSFELLNNKIYLYVTDCLFSCSDPDKKWHIKIVY